jgi:SagB-type dehydrogenase family enzyme
MMNQHREFEQSFPLYRFYQKNQHALIESQYVDDTTQERQWTTGDYKEYRRGDVIEPPDGWEVEDGVLSALRERRSFDDGTDRRPVSREEIFNILSFSYGIKQKTETRPIPSPGQLYPLEIYPLVIDSPDIDSGLYHYNPDRNILERPADQGYLSTEFGPYDDFIENNWHHLDEENMISVMFLVTGLPSRSSVKYGERGYMFTLIESGALVQAIQLAAGCLGIGSRPYAGFRYDLVRELLGLTDHYQEWVLTSIALASPD